MALYVEVVAAVRSANNGIRLHTNLLDDATTPSTLLETRDLTFVFPPDGTNAEKRLAVRAEFDKQAANWIAQRTAADANASQVVSAIVGYRYPPA